jgi:hypothetical protein
MSYPSSRADRYRKAAAEFSDLAKTASSDFSRGYYQRTAERCLLLAEGETSVPQDEAIPIQPASSPPGEMEPKPEVEPQVEAEVEVEVEAKVEPEVGSGKGASRIVRKLARRVARLASRPVN